MSEKHNEEETKGCEKCGYPDENKHKVMEQVADMLSEAEIPAMCVGYLGGHETIFLGSRVKDIPMPWQVYVPMLLTQAQNKISEERFKEIMELSTKVMMDETGDDDGLSGILKRLEGLLNNNPTAY